MTMLSNFYFSIPKPWKGHRHYSEGRGRGKEGEGRAEQRETSRTRP